MTRGILRWIRQPFAVLIYHQVGAGKGSWCVPASRFEEHLGCLAEAGCSFVSTGDILHHMVGGGSLPPRAVAIHFDDGRSGVVTDALPVLRRFDARAAVFVVSGWTARSVPVPEAEAYSEFLAWDEVAELSRDSLIEVGSHGHSHRNLKRLTSDDVVREVEESGQLIADNLGTDVYHFAAPYNRIDARIRRAVIRAGYRTLSGGGGRVNRWLGSPYRLSRFLITSGTTNQDLSRIAEGL